METHVDLGWVARWSTKAYSAGPVTYSLTHLEPGPLPERELLRVMLAVDRVDDGRLASLSLASRVVGGLTKVQQFREGGRVA